MNIATRAADNVCVSIGYEDLTRFKDNPEYLVYENEPEKQMPTGRCTDWKYINHEFIRI